METKNNVHQSTFEPTITELAAAIHKNVAIYDDFLKSSGLPQPSHADLSTVGGPPPILPVEVQSALEMAKEATHDLNRLLQAPIERVATAATDVNRLVAVTFIQHFQVAQKLVPGETKTFKQLADECGVGEEDMRRLLRLAMTDHYFIETDWGSVAHSTATAALLAVPNADSYAWGIGNMTFPAMAKLIDAMSKWPGSEEPHETAFSLAHGLDCNFWDYLTAHPIEAEHFAQSMDFVQACGDGICTDPFLKAFDWSSLPANALFVDVGGSHGSLAADVAMMNPMFRCISQDISKPAIKAGRAKLPEPLGGRVELMVHDFFTAQPVHHADMYVLRGVLHDWPDAYAAKILRNLVPAMKPGARVVVCDFCLPPNGAVPLYQQRFMRLLDCCMKALLNSKERDESQWRKLFEAADPRFKFQNVVMPPGAKQAILEAIWEP